MAKIPGTIKPEKGRRNLRYVLGHGGRKFYVDTETASRREAERNKQRYYQEALAKAEAARKSAALPSEMRTFGEACGAWWKFGRQGKQLEDDDSQGAENSAWSLDWLKRHIGAERLVTEIDDAMVMTLVAQRRGEKIIRGGKTINRPVSPTTVNRSVTQPLRKVLLFARDIGKQPIQRIEWKKRLLAEPIERTRELRDEEQVALFDQGLRDDHKPMVEVALMLGLRRAELIGLKWEHVDFGARLIRVLGKGGTDNKIPLLPAARDVLWDLWSDPDRHPEFVFTFVAQRTREYGGRTFIKGERYAFTAEGWKTAFRRALDEAGIKDFRMHDTRHTAASRLHREIGLVGVQTVLRHKQIETTRKYTHVDNDELMGALQRAADKAAERQEALRRGGPAGGQRAERGVGGPNGGPDEIERSEKRAISDG